MKLIKQLTTLLIIFFPFIGASYEDDVQIIGDLPQVSRENIANINYYFSINDNKDDDLFEIVNFKEVASDRDVNIKNYRGKVIILHFWATWCGYCADEMSDLNKLSKYLKKNEIEDISIIPISIDGENDATTRIKNFYTERNLKSLSMYNDNNRYFSILGSSTLPTTFIIDKKGKQAATTKGPVPWNNENIINYLKSLT